MHRPLMKKGTTASWDQITLHLNGLCSIFYPLHCPIVLLFDSYIFMGVCFHCRFLWLKNEKSEL